MNRPSPPTIANSQWMLSFADLLSLILTFFVLIYSMAQPMQMSNIYKHNYDSLAHQESDVNLSEIQIEKFDSKLTSEYLENIFKAKTEQSNPLENLGIRSDLNKFIISVPLTQLGDEVIEKLTETIGIYDNKKHIYSSSLDLSKKLADQLQKNGTIEGLGFYQQDDIKDRIDIIIYL